MFNQIVTSQINSIIYSFKDYLSVTAYKLFVCLQISQQCCQEGCACFQFNTGSFTMTTGIIEELKYEEGLVFSVLHALLCLILLVPPNKYIKNKKITPPRPNPLSLHIILYLHLNAHFLECSFMRQDNFVFHFFPYIVVFLNGWMQVVFAVEEIDMLSLIVSL